jgi:hypothetical protein
VSSKWLPPEAGPKPAVGLGRPGEKTMFVAYEATCNTPKTKDDYARREYEGDGDNYWKNATPRIEISEAEYDELPDSAGESLN